MFVQKVKALAAGLLVVAVTAGGAFTQTAAEGTEPAPGKNNNREPGHAFAPRGGMAITDDPFKGPSKPLPPKKPSKPFAPAPGTADAPAMKDAETPLQKVFREDNLDPRMLRIPGNRFAVEVTGRTDGECWGTELYFYKSALGTAAVHAGLVKVGEKAVITVTVVKCPKSGEESRQNGVTSLPWDDAATTDTALLLQRLPEKKVPVAKDPAGLTIDEAILAKHDEKVTVMFRVGSMQVENLAPNEPQEWRLITFNPEQRLKNGRKFQVFLQGEAVTPLFRLGLVHENPMRGADYFMGKTVRITGFVDTIEDLGKKETSYRIIVTELRHLEVVR